VQRPDFSQRAFDVLDVWEVHDGDTYALLLDGGFRGYPAPWLRLKGFSAPELKQKGGPNARDVAYELLTDHLATTWVVTTKIPLDLQAKLAKDYGDSPRSFARYIADVWLADGVRLGDELVRAGAARVGSFMG
jgi:endonuclease YncB( thermonuclease family)